MSTFYCMKKTELVNIVNKAIVNQKMSKLYLKDQTANVRIGKFVACVDHQELMDKGMVRFCIQRCIEAFDSTKHQLYTRIVNIESLAQILNIDSI